MSRSAFGRGKCRFCDKTVTSCGFGEWKHLQMHYREVFCKEPSMWMGVQMLTGEILRWKREVIANAGPGSPDILGGLT